MQTKEFSIERVIKNWMKEIKENIKQETILISKLNSDAAELEEKSAKFKDIIKQDKKEEKEIKEIDKLKKEYEKIKEELAELEQNIVEIENKIGKSQKLIPIEENGANSHSLSMEIGTLYHKCDGLKNNIGLCYKRLFSIENNLGIAKSLNGIKIFFGVLLGIGAILVIASFSSKYFTK